MINPSNVKEIVFPHFIPTAKFGEKVYTWDDVNGGSALVEKKGFEKNKFMGGRCNRMGLVKELGLWACLDKFDDKERKRIFAFYMEEPEEVTELGKKFIAEALPGYTVTYKKYNSVDEIPKKTEDPKRLAKAQDEARKLGVSEQAIKGAKAETVESLIKAKQFELAQTDEEKQEVVTKQKQPIRRSAK